MAYKTLTRLTLLLFGASLLVLTGLLWIARQPEAQSAGRAFITDYGDGLHVYRLWRDGRGIRRMTHASDGLASGLRVAWSPDGRWLAYDNVGLHIISVGGGAPIKLTEGFDQAPTWSPDGQSLAFASFSAGSLDIYVIDLTNPEAPRRLTTHAAIDLAPAWSPDGAWIAFASEREGQSDIFRLHPDGSDLQNVTNSGLQDEYSPAWSPDGAWIHFEVGRDRFGRIRPDGSGRRPVRDDVRDVISPSRMPVIDFRLRFSALVGVGVLMLLASGIISRWSKFSPGT